MKLKLKNLLSSLLSRLAASLETLAQRLKVEPAEPVDLLCPDIMDLLREEYPWDCTVDCGTASDPAHKGQYFDCVTQRWEDWDFRP